MRYASLYLDFAAVQIKAMREYPAAFAIRSLAKVVGFTAQVCITYLMIYRFGGVLDWSTFEVLLLFSMNIIGYGLAGFFMFHPFTKLQQRILDGTFDEMLTKPLNPFFYLCSRDFSTGYFANLFVGVAALVVSFSQLDITLGAFQILWLIVVLLGAGMIHSGFFMLTNIPSFWLVKSDAIDGLRGTLESFIRFPISIYDTWIAVMLTYIFPFAFVNFFPAQYFLQMDDFMIFPPILIFMTPVVGGTLMLIGYALFQLGIRNYKSTGS